MDTSDNSPEYFRMRELRERESAEQATSDEVKFSHLALAENYRLLAEEAEQRDRDT